MGSDQHDTPDVPGLPEIQDEAADTPTWIPLTGLAVLLMMTLYVALHAASASSEDTAPAPEAEVAAEAEAPAEPAAAH